MSIVEDYMMVVMVVYILIFLFCRGMLTGRLVYRMTGRVIIIFRKFRI